MKCPICSEPLAFSEFMCADEALIQCLDCPTHFYSAWQDFAVINYFLHYQNETGYYRLHSTLLPGPYTSLTFRSSPEDLPQTVLSAECMVPILQKTGLINLIPRLLQLKAFL
jgi:hypothetical protein